MLDYPSLIVEDEDTLYAIGQRHRDFILKALVKMLRLLKIGERRSRVVQ